MFHGSRRPWALLALILPPTLLFAAFFIFPLGALAVMSFHDYGRLTGILPNFTLKNYQTVFLDPFYLEVILRTLRLALLTSVISLIVGYPVSLYLSVASARQRAWIILALLSPLLISVVVRTFGWLIILSPNGLLDNVLQLVGVNGETLFHTETAIVIGLVNVLLPFLVLSITASLQAIDPAVSLAAASLGAPPLTVFWKIIGPLSLPGVLSGLLIVFSLATSTFVTPALLGGAKYKVLSVLVFQQALVLQNWPLAAAMAISMVIIVVMLVTIQNRFLYRSQQRVEFH